MADIIIPKAHVEWRALAVGQDSGDPDVEPDQIPLAGVRVRLTPSPRKVEVAATETEPARTVTLREWTLITDETGTLTNPESPDDPIAIVASDAFPGVTVEWTSTISAPDTGVPDITKRWLAPAGSTVDLTTVLSVPLSPSPLPEYLAAVQSARAARDVAVSAAERADTSAHWAGQDRAGAEAARDLAVGARDEAVPAAATATSARDLAVAARDATLAAVVITGAGRPDVSASMTAEVRALVAAAGSGAEFRSLDGPQGAWVWRKRGTAWVCVECDTGVVSLLPYLGPNWELNPSGGHLSARRIGGLLQIGGRIRVKAGASIIGTPRSAQVVILPTMPDWCRTLLGDAAQFAPIGHGEAYGMQGQVNAYDAISVLNFKLGSHPTPGNWGATDTLHFSASRLTTSAYPVTL